VSGVRISRLNSQPTEIFYKAVCYKNVGRATVPAKTGRHGLRRAQSCRGRPYVAIGTMFLPSIRLDTGGQRHRFYEWHEYRKRL